MTWTQLDAVVAVTLTRNLEAGTRMVALFVLDCTIAGWVEAAKAAELGATIGPKPAAASPTTTSDVRTDLT